MAMFIFIGTFIIIMIFAWVLLEGHRASEASFGRYSRIWTFGGIIVVGIGWLLLRGIYSSLGLLGLILMIIGAGIYLFGICKNLKIW